MVLRGVIRTAETLRGLAMSGRAASYKKKKKQQQHVRAICEKIEIAHCIQE